jgi:dTDP-4-amino-4,6-dideoxygalactose transaminase
VHFGGRPLDTPRFHEIALRHGIWIVEDAAHAIGAVSSGCRVGGSSLPRTVSVFSFYPNKNLGTAEGGAIATADAELANRLRRLRLHGLDSDAWDRYRLGRFRRSLAQEPGFKCNWTDLQAAIALAQLEKLEGFIAAREYLAARYDALLADLEGAAPVPRDPSSVMWRHALHLYQVAVNGGADRRDEVVAHMQDDGVGAAVHYIGANHHPAYRTDTTYPASDWASSALVTLPLHLHLDDDDVEHVVATLEHALSATRPS